MLGTGCWKDTGKSYSEKIEIWYGENWKKFVTQGYTEEELSCGTLYNTPGNSVKEV
jgi:hypothetical protein